MKIDATDIPELEPVIDLVVRKVLSQIRDEQGDGGRISYREPEAAKLLGVEQHVLAAARRRGAVRATRIGRYVLYARSELLRFTNGLPQQPPATSKSKSATGRMRAVG